jgi:hypothetical protein
LIRLGRPREVPLRETDDIGPDLAASSSKHQSGWFAHRSAGVAARVDRPCRRPLEHGVPIARSWWMVVARVVVALLVGVVPLAAPILAQGALAMIR